VGFSVKIIDTPILDLFTIETQSSKDDRGAFRRFFCVSELASIIGNRSIVQINHSHTAAVGAVRGMHFQYPPNAEMKLVRCLKGKVWDVAVDLRPTSLNYKRWHAQELSAKNAYMMVIPEGFAHGFQVLEADSELLYLHTAFYNPDYESGLRHDDPCLAIKWPLKVTEISMRDTNHAYIDSNFNGITL
jgi:dTDP-4-dehydrorhamnose 3,5-epimerase